LPEDDEYPYWYRRWWRERSFFDRLFEDLDRMFEDFFKRSLCIPEELVRERKLPDGRIVRETGPIVYGYSITIGPDGKPQIREFGNIKPSSRPTPFGISMPEIKVSKEREPLIDIMEEDEEIKVLAELPGVEKDDINLNCTEKTLTISVDTENRKYYKELELPGEVDPKSAKARYKNGVLEVTLKRIKPKPSGERVKIE